MYRVLVVDDEKYIRKSIINRVHWKECGCEIVGEAADGNEALELATLHQPEIIITDIRMPGMVGLQLAQKIASEHPHVKVIIISAYSDFEYAKKAIRYGVREYLLKPVNEKELEETLLRLGKEVEQERGSYSFPECSAETAETHSFPGNAFLVISFYLPSVRDETGQREKTAELYGKMTEEMKKKDFEGEVLFLRGGAENQSSFLWNGKEMASSSMYEIFHELLSGEAEEGNEYWAGISRVMSMEQPDEKGILELESQALTALKRKILEGKRRRIFLFEECEHSEDVFKKYKNDLLLLYDLSVQEDQERMKLQIMEMIAYGLNRAASVAELEFLVGELIFILERVARRRGYLYETRVLFHDLKKSDYLLEFSDKEELTVQMRRMTETVFAWQDGKRYDAVEEIRDYVQQHYMEDLSVACLARKYHLNATYLSSVFKERNNIALSSYIEGIRMEKAKKILREDWGNITEAAMAVGYSDANYFTKVFKKYTGMTPRQWRKTK